MADQTPRINIEGSRAKLRRAKEHFDAIEGYVTTFLRDNPYRVIVEHPSQELYVARLDQPPSIPAEDWALIIGDYIHNLRCALDYIAWELAGADLGDKETMFPIFNTKDGWNRNGPRRIRRLSADAKAFIETAQPYHAADPLKDAMNGINTLDAADKHKLLTIIAARSNDLHLTWSNSVEDQSYPERINIFDGPLTHNAVLATAVITNAPPDMKMEAQFAPDITFGESVGLGRRTHVMRSLAAFWMQASHVVDAAEHRFVNGLPLC